MKVPSIWCVLLLMAGLLCGCASGPSGPAAADAPTQKKGHWVSVPAETGTFISRRVWVEDGGPTNAPPPMNNVQNGSAASMQRLQNSSSTLTRPGS